MNSIGNNMDWIKKIDLEQGQGHSSKDEIRTVFEQMTSCMQSGRQGSAGFMGVPPKVLLEEARELSVTLVDLDMPRSEVSKSIAEKHLPRIYCATLRTILSNALTLPLDWMILATGYDKCDGGRFVAEIIRNETDIPVLTVGNLAREKQPTPISDSHLPLQEKVNRIIGQVSGEDVDIPKSTDGFKVGFWGVPPHDQEILELLPDETRLLGWTRMMEAAVPADIELELWVPDGLPAIFYAQAFCPKNGLAKYLAEKHNGLYVEVDHNLSSSTRAKIEAFLEFRVK